MESHIQMHSRTHEDFKGIEDFQFRTSKNNFTGEYQFPNFKACWESVLNSKQSPGTK